MFVNARAIIERETRDGLEIVIQVRSKPSKERKAIELPGGCVNEYESLVDALAREVHEETGLELTHIEGADLRVHAEGAEALVECLAPFAVYQTLRGPVDSMGVYFRCRATGQLRNCRNETESVEWMPVKQVARWINNPALFSWVDRAGLLFYLKQCGILRQEAL